jgi:hypothetical protein
VHNGKRLARIGAYMRLSRLNYLIVFISLHHDARVGGIRAADPPLMLKVYKGTPSIKFYFNLASKSGAEW